jgi:hypothetical protein
MHSEKRPSAARRFFHFYPLSQNTKLTTFYTSPSGTFYMECGAAAPPLPSLASRQPLFSLSGYRITTLRKCNEISILPTLENEASLTLTNSTACALFEKHRGYGVKTNKKRNQPLGYHRAPL